MRRLLGLLSLFAWAGIAQADWLPGRLLHARCDPPAVRRTVSEYLEYSARGDTAADRDRMRHSNGMRDYLLACRYEEARTVIDALETPDATMNAFRNLSARMYVQGDTDAAWDLVSSLEEGDLQAAARLGITLGQIHLDDLAGARATLTTLPRGRLSDEAHASLARVEATRRPWLKTIEGIEDPVIRENMRQSLAAEMMTRLDLDDAVATARAIQDPKRRAETFETIRRTRLTRTRPCSTLVPDRSEMVNCLLERQMARADWERQHAVRRTDLAPDTNRAAEVNPTRAR